MEVNLKRSYDEGSQVIGKKYLNNFKPKVINYIFTESIVKHFKNDD